MGKSVLVIDDDQDIREALRDGLTLIGYEVLTAENGQQALEILEKAPAPGLILVDIMMPVMDGRQFCERVHQDSHLSQIPVVVITADGHAKQKAQQLKAQAGISKPLDFDELIKIAESYLA